jgi:hypothetical protein
MFRPTTQTLHQTRRFPEGAKHPKVINRCNVHSSHLVYLTDVGLLVGAKIEVAVWV